MKLSSLQRGALSGTVLLFLSLQTFAVNHTASVQQAPGANWDDPAIWTPNDGLAPHAGDTYEVILGTTNPARIRNPINGMMWCSEVIRSS